MKSTLLLLKKYKVVIIGLALSYSFLTSLSLPEVYYRYKADLYAQEKTKDRPFESSLKRNQENYEYGESYLDSVCPHSYISPHIFNIGNQNRMCYTLDFNYMLIAQPNRFRDKFEQELILKEMIDQTSKWIRYTNNKSLYVKNDYDGKFSITQTSNFILKAREHHYIKNKENEDFRKTKLEMLFKYGKRVLESRLATLGIQQGVDINLIYKDSIPDHTKITIPAYLSPEMTPKLLCSKNRLFFLETYNSKALPQKIQTGIADLMPHKSEKPYVLGYVTTQKEMERVNLFIQKHLIFVRPGISFMWSFAKENIGKKNKKGQDIYAYGLYVVRESPSKQFQKLSTFAIDSIYTDFNFNKNPSRLQLPPQIHLILKDRFTNIWQDFTTAQDQRNYAIILDHEVLYDPFVSTPAKNTTITVQDNHRLRDLPYIYAILKNGGLSMDNFTFAYAIDSTYVPVNANQVKKEFFPLFVIVLILLGFIGYLLQHRGSNTPDIPEPYLRSRWEMRHQK